MSAVATTFSVALEGRYGIEREFGAGRTAAVCLPHDIRYDRGAAIRVLNPDLALAPGRDRFAREIRLAARAGRRVAESDA